ncbi:MAG: type I restriction-modification system subunit M [Eggerthellaceae bacterium]|nr:type I restriction-modification system subunit M [Eggerthellaceae bacterium]
MRNGIDAWDFKQYVLGMLFYRYISEDFAYYIDSGEIEAGKTAFSYAALKDEDFELDDEEHDDLIKEKGCFIYPSQLFCNVWAFAKKAEKDGTLAESNLNTILHNTLDAIEHSSVGFAAEEDFQGLFDDFDTSSKRLGGTVGERNKRLLKLMDGIGNMDLGHFGDNRVDAFGDAYEFLMRMYASNAGKSGGEYFTPPEVSRLLMLIALDGRSRVDKVYDPTCGSGGILLQAAKILGNDGVTEGYFGQEKNLTTYNLARINMMLHGINYEKFDIAYGDTLTNPSERHWDEEPFQVIAANPPYSTSWEGDSSAKLADDVRFKVAGMLAPKSKADLAFVMHSLAWLANDGVAAMLTFPGALYRSNKGELAIRKYLVDNDFVDASKYFVPGSPQNSLSEENIQEIVRIYRERADVDHVAKLVTNEKLKDTKYCMSVSAWVEPEDTREKVDIKALNAQIAGIVARETKLRARVDAIVAGLEADDE